MIFVCYLIILYKNIEEMLNENARNKVDRVIDNVIKQGSEIILAIDLDNINNSKRDMEKLKINNELLETIDHKVLFEEQRESFHIFDAAHPKFWNIIVDMAF